MRRLYKDMAFMEVIFGTHKAATTDDCSEGLVNRRR